MPGLNRSIRAEFEAWKRADIGLLISLTPMEEIASRSPAFHAALCGDGVPVEHILFPILDFDVPGDRGSYLELVKSVCERLGEGEHVLVHCFGGIGRTGMTATCILLWLGVELHEARTRVQAAGGGAETASQKELIEWAHRSIGEIR